MAEQHSAWALVDHYLQPIAEFLQDTLVTEICVDRFDRIFVERRGELTQTNARFDSEEALTCLISQIGHALNQPVHPDSYPLLDARLPNGARVNATLHPVATQGSNMTIRCFPSTRLSANELVQAGVLSQEMLDYLQTRIIKGANVMVCGATGSGKTTLLNALLEESGKCRRMVVVEDTRELSITGNSVLYQEAPQRTQRFENAQSVTLSRLIADSLRKRPDTIVVGEIRTSDAANSFLTALNTGHQAHTTIHANSAEDALYRLQTLCASESNLPFDFIASQVKRNVDIVVSQQRVPDVGRRVTQMLEVSEKRLVSRYAWLEPDVFVSHK